MLQLAPPTGDSTVQCKAIARERETARWSQVAPLLQEIQIGRVPVGSVFDGYKDGWATFIAPDSVEMRFDLREPLKLQEAGHATPSTSLPN
jgi:hypothetical protein